MSATARTWIRWSIGASAVAGAFAVGFRSTVGGTDVGGLWFGALLLVVAAVCVFPEVIAAVAAPMSRWVDSLYLPGGKPDPAPLNYRLVRYYQVTRQYDLAVAEYRRILVDYPDEMEAYKGMIGLLVNEFGDRRGARHWLKRGLKNAPDRDGQQRLLEKYGTLLVPQHLLISA